jgi:hypothetical protein
MWVSFLVQELYEVWGRYYSCSFSKSKIISKSTTQEVLCKKFKFHSFQIKRCLALSKQKKLTEQKEPSIVNFQKEKPAAHRTNVRVHASACSNI